MIQVSERPYACQHALLLAMPLRTLLKCSSPAPETVVKSALPEAVHVSRAAGVVLLSQALAPSKSVLLVFRLPLLPNSPLPCQANAQSASPQHEALAIDTTAFPIFSPSFPLPHQSKHCRDSAKVWSA